MFKDVFSIIKCHWSLQRTLQNTGLLPLYDQSFLNAVDHWQWVTTMMAIQFDLKQSTCGNPQKKNGQAISISYCKSRHRLHSEWHELKKKKECNPKINCIRFVATTTTKTTKFKLVFLNWAHGIECMQKCNSISHSLGEVTFSRLENRKQSPQVYYTEFIYINIKLHHEATQCPMQHILITIVPNRAFDRSTNTHTYICNCNAKKSISGDREKNKIYCEIGDCVRALCRTE